MIHSQQSFRWISSQFILPKVRVGIQFRVFYQKFSPVINTFRPSSSSIKGGIKMQKNFRRFPDTKDDKSK